MDKPVMQVELVTRSGKTLRSTELILPATDYEMLDALDKLQLEDDQAIGVEVLEYYRFGCLAPFTPGSHLFEMNLLAQCLAPMNDSEAMAFEGLLNMEVQKMQPFELPRIIDLACNANHGVCDVFPGVRSDRELGEHYLGNDLVPELEGLPDSVIKKMDPAKVGQAEREAEGGVFVPESRFTRGGYVTQHTELEEYYDALPHGPQKPSYAIILEISKGHFHDPAYDNDKTFYLSLPATPQEMDAALEAIEAASWNEAVFQCVDCCVPSMIDFMDCNDSIAHLNRLAQRLSEMEPQQLTKFKAVLDAVGNHSVLGATHIAYTLDDYLFTPQYASPEDMALDFLRSSMGEAATEELRPFVRLHQYGQQLMESQQCELTDYGMVSREDGQCLKTSLSPSAPIQGGMDMTM